jgi:hypothetical protein
MYRENSSFAQHPVASFVLIVLAIVAVWTWKGCTEGF